MPRAFYQIILNREPYVFDEAGGTQYVIHRIGSIKTHFGVDIKPKIPQQLDIIIETNIFAKYLLI